MNKPEYSTPSSPPSITNAGDCVDSTEMPNDDKFRYKKVVGIQSSPIRNANMGPFTTYSSPVRNYNNMGMDLIKQRMDNRIDSMFNPLQHSQYVNERDLHPLNDRVTIRNRFARQQLYRNNKREKLKSNYRGSMEDFYLKQKDKELQLQLEQEANQYQIKDLNRYMEENPTDSQCANQEDKNQRELQAFLESGDNDQ